MGRGTNPFQKAGDQGIRGNQLVEYRSGRGTSQCQRVVGRGGDEGLVGLGRAEHQFQTGTEMNQFR